MAIIQALLQSSKTQIRRVSNRLPKTCLFTYEGIIYEVIDIVEVKDQVLLVCNEKTNISSPLKRRSDVA